MLSWWSRLIGCAAWRAIPWRIEATALLISHRQRSDTCRKPGTAFTTEYKIPGTDARTSVLKCSIVVQGVVR
eukprot:3369945-Amphidinium_carterae.1